VGLEKVELSIWATLPVAALTCARTPVPALPPAELTAHTSGPNAVSAAMELKDAELIGVMAKSELFGSSGVTLPDAKEAGPLPTLFVARTLKV
jgi:hypothetical protein